MPEARAPSVSVTGHSRWHRPVSAVSCAVLLGALLPETPHLQAVAAAAAAAILVTAPARRFPLDAAALAVAVVWLVSWRLSPRAEAPVQMLVLLLVLAGFSRFPTRWLVPALTAILSLALLVLGFATLVDLFRGGMRTTHYPGLGAWGGYPEIGLLGTAVLPVTVTLARHAPTRRTAIAGSLVTLVAAASVLLSYSRGAWAASLAGAGFALVATHRHRAVVTTTAALVLGVAVLGLVPSMGELAGSVLTRSGNVAVETRLEGWQRAATLWRERPVLGWGPGAYRAAFQQRFPGHESDARVHAHSHYLQTAAETGTAGVVVLAVLGLTVLRNVTRPRPDDSAVSRVARIGVACGMCAVALRFTLDFFDPAGAALPVLILLAMLAGIGVADEVAPAAGDSPRA